MWLCEILQFASKPNICSIIAGLRAVEGQRQREREIAMHVLDPVHQSCSCAVSGEAMGGMGRNGIIFPGASSMEGKAPQL